MWQNIRMSYSLGFNQKVLAYKEKHSLTFQQTSKHFETGMRTQFRWSDNIYPWWTRNKPATKVDMDVLIKEAHAKARRKRKMLYWRIISGAYGLCQIILIQLYIEIEGANHHLSVQKHRIQTLTEMLAFFDKHLK